MKFWNALLWLAAGVVIGYLYAFYLFVIISPPIIKAGY